MISNHRSNSYGRQPYDSHKYTSEPRPLITEETLDRRRIQIEQKTFTLILKENMRGRYLRISEQCGEFQQSIVIPATGLEDFQNILIQMVNADGEFPPALPSRY